MDTLRDALSGRKTYIVSLLLIVYAVLGGYLGRLESMDLVQLLLEALGLAGLRAAVAKR